MMAPLRVLLVDDEVDFVESVAEVVEDFGHEVTVVHRGADAVAMAKERDFDLVLLDMKMPGLNGVQTLAALRQHRPGLRVVMMTAFTWAEFVNQGFPDGLVIPAARSGDAATLRTTLAFLRAESSCLVVGEESAARAVEADGHRVQRVRSPSEAVGVLAREGFDAIILDPGDGDHARQWYDAVAAASPGSPVVLAASDWTTTLNDLPSVGYHDIIFKPFAPDVLLDRLEGIASSAA